MRRTFLFSALILIILSFTVMACGSTPPPPPERPAVEPASPPPPPPTPPRETYNRHSTGVILDGAETYTVKEGDTLVSISREFYQDGSYYPLIMMVSEEITDPDMIFPGMHLTVPVLRTNLDDSRAKEGINRSFADTARIEEQRSRHGTAQLIQNHVQ